MSIEDDRNPVGIAFDGSRANKVAGANFVDIFRILFQTFGRKVRNVALNDNPFAFHLITDFVPFGIRDGRPRHRRLASLGHILAKRSVYRSGRRSEGKEGNRIGRAVANLVFRNNPERIFRIVGKRQHIFGIRNRSDRNPLSANKLIDTVIVGVVDGVPSERRRIGVVVVFACYYGNIAFGNPSGIELRGDEIRVKSF